MADNSCWTCIHHRHSPQTTLLGSCFHPSFKSQGKFGEDGKIIESKEIGPDRIDVGCKLHLEF